LHVEDTAALVDHVEAAMREVIPRKEIESMVDNIGLPVSGINMTYANSGTFGSSDADILISLKPDHAPTADYVRKLRMRLPREFPGTVFGFLPADIVSQILNFGTPSPIDIQISGSSPQNHDIANALMASLRRVPGLVDLRVGEVFNQPELRVTTDRDRAQQLGCALRYDAGVADYVEVTTTHTAALQEERDATSARVLQLNAAVGLVRATGGGWRG
jgi:multidrug efflux pump subunit AcrB